MRGVLALALLLALWPEAIRAQVSSETVLHSFHGAATLDGAFLYSNLTLGVDDVLYGTTWGGGTGAGGTVFRINTDGTGYAILHNFTFAPGASAPYSSLLQARDGALYGTTYWGGTSNAGTIFRIGTNGNDYRVLHSFTGTPDGANPWAGLVQGQDGVLYGTTWGGGSGSVGTVFKINTNGDDYAVLHSFVNGFQDGSTPYAGLMQGQDGALYGTTSSGGSTLGGTVYRITADGGSYKVLYNFQRASGSLPKSAVIQGQDGMLYGTTFSGGASSGGVIYRLKTDGLEYAVLCALSSGAHSASTLFQARDGALYGTTEGAGQNSGGNIFRLQTDGSQYSVVHEFASGAGSDGFQPMAGLTGSGGGIYGTTHGGGVWGFGTVYRLALLPTLSISRSDQGARVSVAGFSGQACLVQASTNLVDWVPYTTLVLTHGGAEFFEPDTANTPRRFYRVLVQ